MGVGDSVTTVTINRWDSKGTPGWLFGDWIKGTLRISGIVV